MAESTRAEAAAQAMQKLDALLEELASIRATVMVDVGQADFATVEMGEAQTLLMQARFKLLKASKGGER